MDCSPQTQLWHKFNKKIMQSSSLSKNSSQGGRLSNSQFLQINRKLSFILGLYRWKQKEKNGGKLL